MAKVLVIDAEQGRIPLNITQSLGRKRILVHVGGNMSIATPYFSRYCKHKIMYPNIHEAPEKFKQFMFNYIRKEKFDAVFPVMNDTVLFFSKHKPELSKYTTVPFADYPQMKLAMDKSATLKLAEQLDVPCPLTCHPNSIQDLDEIAGKLSFPLIVKRRHGYGSIGLKLCQNKEELQEHFHAMNEQHKPVIVQEYIPPGGKAIGVSCLFDYQHRPRAIFTHQRIREFPIDGGPSTLRMSIRHPEAEAIAVKLLKELKWVGVAMVEFKIDPRDGKPKLMEINPRFWGSLSLPIFAGVDFPYLLYKLATEGQVEEVKEYRLGVKSKWMGGEFLYFLHAPNKLKFVKEFFKFDRDTCLEDYPSDDLLPAFSRLLSIPYVLDKKIWSLVLRPSKK